MAKKKGNHPPKQLPNKKKYTAFFAYPSNDQAQMDIIEKAISMINEQAKTLYVHSWKSLGTKASRIITNIIESISKSDILIADLTDLNPNVMFEIGFAFGKNKSLLLFTQGHSTTKKTKDLKDLEFISTLFIDSFQNSRDLCEKINGKDLSSIVKNPDFQRYGHSSDVKQILTTGLFLKGVTNHEFGQTALINFREYFTQLLVDDWLEDGSQTLGWYIKSVIQSSGIVALFINPEWDRSREINARFSFVCGMAVALNKKVSMLGLPGFDTPFDYKDILKTINSSDQAIQVIERSFNQLKMEIIKPTVNEIYPDEIDTAQSSKSKTFEQDNTTIQDANEVQVTSTVEDKELILIDVHLGNLQIGNTIAENEEYELSEYFVETGQFKQAVQAKQAIVVGSKGTGKTATFFQIRDQFGDKTHFVCDIKPSGYKIARFINALKKLSDPHSMASHVAESAWKLIIYSNLLMGLKKELEATYPFANYSIDQYDLLHFIEEFNFIIEVPFEQQLDITSKWLEEEKFDSDNFTKKIHDQFLNKAKNILSPILRKKEKTIVLVDNLDKDWMVDSDLAIQSQMVFSILGIHRKLVSELGNGNENISMIVFLRRNIFEYILRKSREPDKLIADSIELSWDDQSMLLRVIEERFKAAIERNTGRAGNTWVSYFTEQVDSVPTKDWIFQHILPRPRDAIHFLLRSIEYAINRKHDKILEDDLKSALKNHSAFALDQIIAEYQAEEPWLSEVLNSFAGTYSNWQFKSIWHHIDQLNIKEDYKKTIGDIIASLVAVRFLGVKLSANDVRFASNIQEGRLLTNKVRTHSLDEPLNLVIHPVFAKHLGLKDNICSETESRRRKIFEILGDFIVRITK